MYNIDKNKDLTKNKDHNIEVFAKVASASSFLIKIIETCIGKWSIFYNQQRQYNAFFRIWSGLYFL